MRNASTDATGLNMAQTANSNSSSGREAAVARRRAMSSAGKAGIGRSPAPGTQTGGSNAASRTPAPSAEAVPARAPSGKLRSAAAASTGRSASRARREAMSSRGKLAISSGDRVREAPAPTVSSTPAPAGGDARQGGCGCGCKGDKAADMPGQDLDEKIAQDAAAVSRSRSSAVRKPARNAGARFISKSAGRSASLARRQAQSARGKAGVSANGMTPAQTARAANPQLSGRELAQALRSQRSRNGNAGQKKAEPSGRMRPAKPSVGAAQDASWKVGAGETAHGQIMTGTQVGRSRKVTGDEPSTCRAVTGTEYMGADIFREFCQAEPGKGPRKVGVSPTGRGNRVTGNEVGRAGKVTGDEPGTCKRVTGTEYVGAGQSETFCSKPAEAGPAKVTAAETRKGRTVTGNNVGRSDKVTGDEPGARRELTGTQYMQSGNGKAPAKVGASTTLRGGAVTGTLVGRSGHVTGDEPGGCRNITGDDYIGQEQYGDFCAATPRREHTKVGASRTLRGETVTGTRTGRSGRVTGDEPGTCKAITGTPYAGAEQFEAYCQPGESAMAAARTRPQRATPGAVMTGLQPGLGGPMTGDRKGACEPLTGTPYVGADQFAVACPATAAEPGSPDYPQPLEAPPWGQFSVTAPAQAAQVETAMGAVTGTRYEQGQITGPFGMATGKVTGTEEFRFGHGTAAAHPGYEAIPATAASVDERVKSRITGEGMDVGSKITGDDWERGDRVTGTEGTSAIRRNPTRRGGAMLPATPVQPAKRNDELPAPASKVTGGSGNTERGALVTYSGGARG
jgi:hypothetical protein